MLYCIMGNSGSGKSTIADKLAKEYGYKILITATTRPPRPGEVNGVDYHFISDYIVNILFWSDQIAECRRYIVATGAVWRYMTLQYDINKIKVSDEDLIVVASLEQFYNYYNIIPDKVIPIILKVGSKERFNRALQRDPNQDLNELNRRIYQASEFPDMNLIPDKFVVYNDDLQETVENISHIIKKEYYKDYWTLHSDIKTLCNIIKHK